MGTDYASLIRSFGGLALEYVSITETDFASVAGTAYVPPERGTYRRITGARQIQILQDCPGVIETFQSSLGELFLPCNNVGNDNDAGDGRIFFLKNSGSGTITVKDYVGNTVFVVQQAGHVIIVGNDNNNWDYYFDASGIKYTPDGIIFTSDNVQDAIYESYVKSKGIRTFPFELHYVSGTGLNTNMSNGSFFRVRPGTFSSGSYSGYPAAFPLQIPFDCKLFSIVLTFRQASFDWNANFGPILFEIETRDHYYNGSDIHNRILVRFGNWNFSSTGTATHQFELFYNDTGGQGFSYISGNQVHGYGDMVGCRFVKAPSGDRRINSFRDIVMKLNFEEVI